MCNNKHFLVFYSGLYTVLYLSAFSFTWSSGLMVCTRLPGSPPFCHRKQMLMLRAILAGKYDFRSLRHCQRPGTPLCFSDKSEQFQIISVGQDMAGYLANLSQRIFVKCQGLVWNRKLSLKTKLRLFEENPKELTVNSCTKGADFNWLLKEPVKELCNFGTLALTSALNSIQYSHSKCVN